MALVAVLGLAHLLQACQGKGYVIVSGESAGDHAIRVFVGACPLRSQDRWNCTLDALGLGEGHKGPHVMETNQPRQEEDQGTIPKLIKSKSWKSALIICWVTQEPPGSLIYSVQIAQGCPVK